MLLPSQQEGLPRSIMEAMVMGVPVIGTDIRGTQDLLEKGCGTLYPVGDVETLARIFEKMAACNPSFVSSAACATNQVKRYDLAALLKMHEELYALLLKS